MGGPVTAMIYELVFKAGRDGDIDGAGEDTPVVQIATSSSLGPLPANVIAVPSPSLRGQTGGGGQAALNPLNGVIGGSLSSDNSNASLLGNRMTRNSGGEPSEAAAMLMASSSSAGSLPPPTPPHRGIGGGAFLPGSQGQQQRSITVQSQLSSSSLGLAPLPPQQQQAGAQDGRSFRGNRVALAMQGGGGGAAANPDAADAAAVRQMQQGHPLSHPIFASSSSSANLGLAAPTIPQPTASSNSSAYAFPPIPVEAAAGVVGASSTQSSAREGGAGGSYDSRGEWR